MIRRRILLGFGASATFAIPDATPARAAVSRGPSSADLQRRGKPLVFLDPGHGGKDPGAIGVSGTYEKHVAIAAARELRRRLEAGGRYQVAVSRDTDVFIPLDQRVAMAQTHGAALFVSLHADAVVDHAVRGASVYTLAAQASDVQTAALARRENAAGQPTGVTVDGVTPEVARILASLVRQETRVRSAAMARYVVGALRPDVGLLENPARHAGFAVLRAANVPSVLVEMGFMSNPQDEAALQRADHRAVVTAALHRAIDGFFGEGSGSGGRRAGGGAGVATQPG